MYDNANNVNRYQNCGFIFSTSKSFTYIFEFDPEQLT